MASIETIINHPVQPDEMFVPQETDYLLPQIVRVNDRHPRTPAHHRPVLICGGWSASARALGAAADEIVGLGRRVVTYDQNPNLICATEPNFSVHQTRKAATALTVLNQCNIARASVAAYSESAISALLAAKQWPERFDSVVLVNPAGLTGPKSLGHFVLRAPLCLGRDVGRLARHKGNLKSASTALYDSSRYVLRDPRLAMEEVRAIAATEVVDLIDWVRASGVKVGVLVSNKDVFFSAQEIMRKVEGRVDLVASFNSKRAGHNELVVNPALAAPAAEEMMRALEEAA